MRVLLGLAVCIVVLSFAVSGLAETTPGTVHTYDSWGFSLSLPSTCQPVSLGNIGGGAGLQEAYSSNGLAYVVVGLNMDIPKNMNVRTAVSMGIQQVSATSHKNPGVNLNLVSATTADGEPVQGFGMTVTESTTSSMGKIPPEVKALFGSVVYQAAVIIPVKDSPATIGVIAVVGPSARQGEIISQMMQVAGTFTRGKSAVAGSFSSGSSEVIKGSGGPKGSKTTAPPQPQVKSINSLKKGQIELVGVVKSTDPVAKSLDMLVTQAVSFSGNGVIISPPRLKRIFVKQIAEGVKEGAIIIVVGGDTGPGKSVTADTLTVMDPSRLGL